MTATEYRRFQDNRDELADDPDRVLKLLREVYLCGQNGCESFEDADMIGPDLAYLLGAILCNDVTTTAGDSALVKLLREILGDEHPVWWYLVMEDGYHHESEKEFLCATTIPRSERPASGDVVAVQVGRLLRAVRE